MFIKTDNSIIHISDSVEYSIEMKERLIMVHAPEKSYTIIDIADTSLSENFAEWFVERMFNEIGEELKNSAFVDIYDIYNRISDMLEQLLNSEISEES